MLKVICSAALVLIAPWLLFTGCEKNSAPPPEEVAAALSKPFSAGIELTYGEGGGAEGELSFSPAETVLKVTAPELLAGLCVTLTSDGDTLLYGEMEKSLPAGALSAAAPAKLISAALSSASRADGIETSMEKGNVKVTGRNGGGVFVLMLGAETLKPLSLSLPGVGVEALFS